jgi:hypothetical protein
MLSIPTHSTVTRRNINDGDSVFDIRNRPRAVCPDRTTQGESHGGDDADADDDADDDAVANPRTQEDEDDG